MPSSQAPHLSPPANRYPSSNQRARVEVRADLGYPGVHDPKELTEGDYVSFYRHEIGYDAREFAVDHLSFHARGFHARRHLEKKGLDLDLASDRTVGKRAQKGHI